MSYAGVHESKAFLRAYFRPFLDWNQERKNEYRKNSWEALKKRKKIRTYKKKNLKRNRFGNNSHFVLQASKKKIMSKMVVSFR